MPPRPSDAAAPAAPPPRAQPPALRRNWIRDVARAQQTSLGIATAVVGFLLIARITLKPDGPYLPAQFDLCIFCGGRGTADFILNVLLFVPFGFGLRLAGTRRRVVCATAVLLTITIEALQYWVVPGRDSGLNDIVSNSLGGCLGLGLADAIGSLLAPTPALARRMGLLAGVAWCAIAGGVQWILQPVLPSTVYYEQVSPDLVPLAVFDGVVLSARFNGSPFRIGRMDAASSAVMRTALLGGHAQIEARVLPGTSRWPLAPIVTVYDQDGQQILVLGRRHDDVVFRLRRHSQDLRFLPVTVALAKGFPPGIDRNQPVTLTVTVRRGVWLIDASWNGGVRHSQFGDGVWEGWRLFLPDNLWYADHPITFTVLWILVLCAPMGYWAGRAARITGIAWAAAPPLVALFVALAIIPMVAGAPPAPWLAWTAGAAGVALAWGLARWIDA
jgi:hypothetical protein